MRRSLAALALAFTASARAARTVFDLNANWLWKDVSAKAGGPAAGDCAVPECAPVTDDGAWRAVTVPHDGVVEGNFSQFEDASAGFLPPVCVSLRGFSPGAECKAP